jgi:peptide-methionine (S)-S-oxide reductase
MKLNLIPPADRMGGSHGSPQASGRSLNRRRVVALILLTMNTLAAATNTSAPAHLATFGGGCFWCIEAVFEKLEGVKSVRSGYAGGRTENPTYQQVCTGNTGHAEVVQIDFDPAIVRYEQLLELFWEAHDPTTLNRQGADEGTQYRSIILYQDEAQKLAAEKSKREASKRFKGPIVTEIVPATTFHPAETYHQDYFRNNPRNPYCAAVISPKLKKLEKSALFQKLEAK